MPAQVWSVQLFAEHLAFGRVFRLFSFGSSWAATLRSLPRDGEILRLSLPSSENWPRFGD